MNKRILCIALAAVLITALACTSCSTQALMDAVTPPVVETPQAEEPQAEAGAVPTATPTAVAGVQPQAAGADVLQLNGAPQPIAVEGELEPLETKVLDGVEQHTETDGGLTVETFIPTEATKQPEATRKPEATKQPEATRKPEETKQPEATKEAEVQQQAEPSILSLGVTSDRVAEVQQRLIDLGYLSASATGYYGPATQAAVMAFQSAHGLNADGKAGEATCNKLFSDDAKKAEAKPSPTPEPAQDDPEPADEPPGGGYTYSYLSDVTEPTGWSGAQLEKAVAGTNLAGLGSAYAAAEQNTGVNALFLMAITVHESGWGTSSLARNQNNLCGMKTADWSGFRSFGSKEECVSYLASHLANNYLNGGKYDNGHTSKGVAQRYCETPDSWYQSVESVMQRCYNKIVN